MVNRIFWLVDVHALLVRLAVVTLSKLVEFTVRIMVHGLCKWCKWIGPHLELEHRMYWWTSVHVGGEENEKEKCKREVIKEKKRPHEKEERMGHIDEEKGDTR